MKSAAGLFSATFAALLPTLPQEAAMRKNNKVLLDAEEQLVFGQSLAKVSRARDNLRQVLPGCLLVELLDAKIVRMRWATPRRVSPWGV